MELNEQQKNAVTYNGEAKNILVTAGAGCGKTRTIIARAIHFSTVWYRCITNIDDDIY